VQVHRQQFHHLVRACEGAIDPRPAVADHLPRLVDRVDGQQLGLAPLALVTPLLFLGFALAFLLACHLAQPYPAAVELRDDAFAGRLRACGHLPVAIAFQVAAAGDQQLFAEAMAAFVDHLDVQFQAAPGQFLTGHLKGRHQGRWPGHQADQSAALTSVKAEDGQLRVEAAVVLVVAFAFTRLWSAVKGGHPQDQAAK
jgi:hypothetical protein